MVASLGKCFNEAGCKQRHCILYAAVAGTLLANFPSGVMYFYGNLAVYTDSYFAISCGSRCNDVSSSAILSLYAVFQSLGMLSARLFVSKLGLSASCVLAMLLSDIGYFLSYFTVQSSVAATVATLGGMAGFGQGLLLNLSFYYVSELVPTHVGVLSGCVSSSSTLGSPVINQLIMYHINPGNQKVDVTIGERKYFSNPEVLSSVPSVFLLIGAFSLICQIAAVVLLVFSPRTTTMTHTAEVNAEKGDNEGHLKTSLSETSNLVGLGAHADTTNGGKQTNCPTFDANNGHVNDKKNYTAKADTPTAEETKCATNSVSSDRLTAKQNPKRLYDYTPLAMIREPRFYIIWVSLAVLHYAILQKNTYYKTFAEVWIDDDSFLTAVATMYPILFMPSRALIGKLIDSRILTLKDAIIVGLGPDSVFLAFWYFTPSTSKWLYMFWTFALTVFQSGVYVTYPVVVLKFYGITHYTTNLGIMVTSMTFVSLISSTVNESILESGGWFWLLFTSAAVNALAMVAVIVFVEN